MDRSGVMPATIRRVRFGSERIRGVPWSLRGDAAEGYAVIDARGEEVATRLRSYAEAEFIAAAPADVRYLLAELRRAEGERDVLWARSPTITQMPDRVSAAILARKSASDGSFPNVLRMLAGQTPRAADRVSRAVRSAFESAAEGVGRAADALGYGAMDTLRRLVPIRRTLDYARDELRFWVLAVAHLAEWASEGEANGSTNRE